MVMHNAISQIGWMLFLKIFDEMEEEWRRSKMIINPSIPKDLRWRTWAADEEGMTG
jgi:type I restriction enzyme M protein